VRQEPGDFDRAIADYSGDQARAQVGAALLGARGAKGQRGVFRDAVLLDSRVHRPERLYAVPIADPDSGKR